jgi:hypothetical protein
MRRKNPDLCPLLINSTGYWPSTAEPEITQWQRRASLSLNEETVLKTVNFNSQNFPVWKISVFLPWKERDLAPLVKGTKLRPAATDKGDLMYQRWHHGRAFSVWHMQRGITTVFLSCGHLSTVSMWSLWTCESSNAMRLSITSQYQQVTTEKRQSLNQAFLYYKFRADHSVRTQKTYRCN